MTIDILPDVALLKIFDIYGGDAYDHDKRYDEQIEAWHTLVHVCRKWRTVVFGSPLRLNLRLHCKARTPVRRTLDVWPLLPIVVWENDEIWDVDNISAALNHSERICELRLYNIRSSQLKKVLAAMQQPFPALTRLWILESGETVPASLSGPSFSGPSFPGISFSGASFTGASFTGATAPRLQSLALSGIPLPGIPKLLLSATHLVRLYLIRIPHFEYIQPEAIVTCLSLLTRLEKLELGFESPRCRPDRRRLPPRTRTLLPVLTRLEFKGVGEYLEDFVARIDTPLLGYLSIAFFHQLIFDTPHLSQFISRTPELKASDYAFVQFLDQDVSVESRHSDGQGNKCIKLGISCGHIDWQLSSLAQIFNSSFPQALLLAVESLVIRSNESQMRWQDDIEGNQWLELLHSFTAVKNLYVPSKFMQGIALAAQEPVGGSVPDVLPALQNLFLGELRPSEPVQEAIGHFVTARQLSGHAISISPWGGW